MLRSHPNTGVRDGVFSAAYRLQDSGTLPDYQHEELSDLLRWFDNNLEIPSRLNRTKSKGYHCKAKKGISWFKPSAVEPLSNMRRMITILEDHGHHVSMIKTANPGYVVYQDQHQVVAEPFRDTCA